MREAGRHVAGARVDDRDRVTYRAAVGSVVLAHVVNRLSGSQADSQVLRSNIVDHLLTERAAVTLQEPESGTQIIAWAVVHIVVTLLPRKGTEAKRIGLG